MKCLIAILLSLLIAFGGNELAFAQNASETTSESPVINLTPEDLKQMEEWQNQAFTVTSKGDFAAAENYWTQILEKFPDNPAALSNRGNAKVSQNKLESAIEDFNRAIEIAPNITDPYLNRGTALEGLGRWSDAIADYNRILDLDPDDAMAYNNRGNAYAGIGNWEEAIANYRKATEIAPTFAIARANYALALYEADEKDKAIREMKNIVRRYPSFADVRAALSAVLWADGKQGEAESNWVSAYGLDYRYKDIDWVKNIRRWPPSMVSALDKFLKLS
ncbi:MAG: tetratricopeptide repeat protein [Mastigocoleus sp.]